MKTKKIYTPITIESEHFQDFMLPTDTVDLKELFVITEYLSNDSTDGAAILEESIVKLFKEAFDIDIKTCTEREWAERITIKGGALKQWQSLLTLPNNKKMSNKKASLIFVAFSVVLIIAIGLLPKSVTILVPASASAVTATSR